jgi:hypothetical protein
MVEGYGLRIIILMIINMAKEEGLHLVLVYQSAKKTSALYTITVN